MLLTHRAILGSTIFEKRVEFMINSSTIQDTAAAFNESVESYNDVRQVLLKSYI